MPVAVLGPGDTVVNKKMQKSPPPWSLFSIGGTDNRKHTFLNVIKLRQL